MSTIQALSIFIMIAAGNSYFNGCRIFFRNDNYIVSYILCGFDFCRVLLSNSFVGKAKERNDLGRVHQKGASDESL